MKKSVSKFSTLLVVLFVFWGSCVVESEANFTDMIYYEGYVKAANLGYDTWKSTDTSLSVLLIVYTENLKEANVKPRMISITRDIMRWSYYAAWAGFPPSYKVKVVDAVLWYHNSFSFWYIFPVVAAVGLLIYAHLILRALRRKEK